MLLQVEVNLAWVTTIVSALVGLLSGWLAAYLKVKGENLATKEDFTEALRRLEQNTAAVERIRSEITKRSSLDSELRQTVKQATTAIGALVHSICWLTWDCVARERIDGAMVKRYDDEAHKLMPEIIGHLAGIAMLRSAVHAKLSPLADAAIALDAKTGGAIVAGEKDLPAGLQELHNCHVAGNELERQVRAVVSDLFALESDQPQDEKKAREALDKLQKTRDNEVRKLVKENLDSLAELTGD